MTAAVKLEMTSFYGSLKCSESFKFIAESPIMNLKRLKTHWSISSITIGTPPDAPPDVLAAAFYLFCVAQSRLSTAGTQGHVSGARVSPTEGEEVVTHELEEGGGHQGVAGGAGGVVHLLAPIHPPPELDPARRAPVGVVQLVVQPFQLLSTQSTTALQLSSVDGVNLPRPRYLRMIPLFPARYYSLLEGSVRSLGEVLYEV